MGFFLFSFNTPIEAAAQEIKKKIKQKIKKNTYMRLVCIVFFFNGSNNKKATTIWYIIDGDDDDDFSNLKFFFRCSL